MKALGADVTFIQTIFNRTSVTDAFNQIMDTGLNIDVVVHGAGAEESKPLAKDLFAFRRVYHSKVQGALNILDNIPPSTFFLSMIHRSRFGNQGQGDYSAANDAIGYICQQRSIFFTFAGPLAEVNGFNVQGITTTQRGIQLLPLEFAVDQAIAMTELRLLGEVIVTERWVPYLFPLHNSTAQVCAKGVQQNVFNPDTAKEE